MSEPVHDRLRLHVLGTPDLRAADGRRLGSILSQPKRLGLLTYLALAPAPVARASVIAAFWPEVDEARGRNALSQALFHLRRALGEHVVESVEGDRLRVSPERLWCDARELLGSVGPALEPSTLSGLSGAASRELLEGWRPDEPPLQAWLEEQRALVRDRLAGAATSWRPASGQVLPEPSGGPTPVGEPGADPPPRSPATPSPPPKTPHGPHAWRLRWAALAGAAALAAVVAAAGRLGGGPSTQDLAVLLPRVTVAPGAPELSAQVILDEVLAHLPTRDHVRIIPAPSAASVPAFRTQLAAIGATDDDVPDWILEVSVRVSADGVGVVGLLYRSPALDVPGRESFGVTYEHADGALLDAPREIARGVAAMVERVLDAG